MNNSTLMFYQEVHLEVMVAEESWDQEKAYFFFFFIPDMCQAFGTQGGTRARMVLSDEQRVIVRWHKPHKARTKQNNYFHSSTPNSSLRDCKWIAVSKSSCN